MATIASTIPTGFCLPLDWSLADLQAHLGGIPAERIRLFPAPGTATADDVAGIAEHEGRLFELIDGILVEKTVGIFESLVAAYIITEINLYLRSNDLGQAFTTDATLRILPGMVRIPDACFISWQRIPTGVARRPKVPALAPDLAVEVISESNTRREMAAKLADYFAAGVRLVWYIDPGNRSAEVFTSPDNVERVDESGVLDGRDVLPGFRVSMRELFKWVERQPPLPIIP